MFRAVSLLLIMLLTSASGTTSSSDLACSSGGAAPFSIDHVSLIRANTAGLLP